MSIRALGSMRGLGLGLAAAGLLLAGPALAGDIFLSTVVPASPNPTNFAMQKHGKVKILPNTIPGGGGITLQLILSNVDCPPNNDGNVAGKCGVKGSPIINHVMALSATAFNVDADDIVGIKYKLELGKAAFQATGKNKIGGAAFGAIVSAIFNQPLGIGYIKLHQAGSNPSDCDDVPLATGNGCIDGDIYARTGVVVGSDPGVTCSSNAQCGITQICVASACAQEPCTTDANCDQNGTGNGGSGQCGSNGTCCDPNIDPTCTGQVP